MEKTGATGNLQVRSFFRQIRSDAKTILFGVNTYLGILEPVLRSWKASLPRKPDLGMSPAPESYPVSAQLLRLIPRHLFSTKRLLPSVSLARLHPSAFGFVSAGHRTAPLSNSDKILYTL